jgi:hypothetical protein
MGLTGMDVLSPFVVTMDAKTRTITHGTHHEVATAGSTSPLHPSVITLT